MHLLTVDNTTHSLVPSLVRSVQLVFHVLLQISCQNNAQLDSIHLLVQHLALIAILLQLDMSVKMGQQLQLHFLYVLKVLFVK